MPAAKKEPAQDPDRATDEDGTPPTAEDESPKVDVNTDIDESVKDVPTEEVRTATTVYIPEEPSADDPILVPQEGLASAGSTADIPPHGDDVVVVPTGEDTKSSNNANDRPDPSEGANETEGDPG